MRSFRNPDSDESEPLALSAFVGTAVGDLLEKALKQSHPTETVTQERIVCTLPRTKIKLAGSTDVIRRPGWLYDWKTKAGLEEIRRYGPSDENLMQLAVYFLGAVQMGLLTEDGHAALVYVDRSGREVRFETVTIDYATALTWIEIAEGRLDSVVEALRVPEVPEPMRFALRDKPPSWCFAVRCPMRQACWEGSEHWPTGAIEHPVEVDAVMRYMTAREEMKRATEMQKNARTDLIGVEGITPGGVIVSWTGADRSRIDVRQS